MVPRISVKETHFSEGNRSDQMFMMILQYNCTDKKNKEIIILASDIETNQKTYSGENRLQYLWCLLYGLNM